jgi:pSer/pThr/pTyr-binding forkhead associated (FHA) protein
MPVRVRILAGAADAAAEGAAPAVERALELPDHLAEIRIGRRADLEVPLPFGALSVLHARLLRGAGGWLVEDLGSSNGTWMGGQRLPARAPRPIAAGAELALAQVTIVFDGAVAGAAAATAERPEGTATLARRLVHDLLAAAPRGGFPTVEVLAGPDPGRCLELRDGNRPYVVGRGHGCDLPLVTVEISREHASFVWTDQGVVVRDLGSKNGVTVNEVRTAAEQPLHDGDVVALGPVTLRLRDPVERYLAQMEAAAPQAPAPAAASGDAPPRLPQPATVPPAPRPRARRGGLMIGFALALLAAVAAATVALVVAG